MLCDIPRCEGGGVVEGVRSEKQEKVMAGRGRAGEMGIGGRAEGGAGKRGSRMTPWPGTYGAPDCWARLPTPSFYQKANPEEEAKSSFSLFLSSSLLNILLRPALSTSNPLGFSRVAYTYPPTNTTTTTNSTIASNVPSSRPPPPPPTSLAPLPPLAHPSSFPPHPLSTSGYLILIASGGLRGLLLQGVLLLSDIIYNSEAGRKPT